MLKTIWRKIREKSFLSEENKCKFILTKNKLEKNKDRWKVVEKQTVSSIFSFEEALEVVKNQTFEGKFIKINFDVLRIDPKNVVKHFSGEKLFGDDRIEQRKNSRGFLFK